MPPSIVPFSHAIFPTQLGWMAIVFQENRLQRLLFGLSSEKAVRDALKKLSLDPSRPIDQSPLIPRLQAFAEGQRDSFQDILVEVSGKTDFQREVIRQCRAIPFGTTTTYGALAARAGFPRAARAVGTCMAQNTIPLIVPCHRVVAADGRLGNYSAPGGIAMKKRLIELEEQTKKAGRKRTG